MYIYLLNQNLFIDEKKCCANSCLNLFNPKGNFLSLSWNFLIFELLIKFLTLEKVPE